MRHKYSNLWFTLLILVSMLTPALVSAQVSEQEKEQKESEKRQELERKTLGLLDEITSGAWSLRLAENRSFVQATAADLLWTRDEKRARNLFWEALNSLGLTPGLATDETKKDTTKNSNSKTTPAKSQNNDKALRQYYEAFNARRNFLSRVARRDPQLALDMLRATRQPPPSQINTDIRLPDESDLEQDIANEAAERDPKRALQIARESLAKGLRFESMNLLFRLNQQNQEAGTEFAGDIITKLQTANLTKDLHAGWIAHNLLVTSRTPKARTGDDSTPQFSWKQLRLSDDQKRTLVELLTDVALAASTNPNAVNGLSDLMTEIEQFAPDRVPKIKAKMAQATYSLTKSQQDWNTLASNGTPEEMIKAGASVGDEERNTLYREAVIRAAAAGRADALREYINGQIEDESRRTSLLDSLDEQQIGFAANRGKTEELKKLLELVRLKEQKAWAMAEIAILMEKKGEHDQAVKLLDEAQALVKVDLKSERQSRALLALLLAYALVDPAKALAMVEPIIDRANDDISKLLLLDKLVKTEAVKNGEIILNQPGIPLDFAILKYGPGIIALAREDFNRTKSLADRFQRNELRLFARLLLAQSILSNLDASPNRAQTTGR